MDAQNIIVLFSHKRNGIIQVLGIVSVDGHHHLLAQIPSFSDVGTFDLYIHILRFLQHLWFKYRRQMKGSDNGSDIHPRIPGIA